MSVQATHPQYDKFKDRWIITTDVVNADVMKYLKIIEPGDEPRNIQYKNDAILTNFTARTKHGLVGAAFGKPLEALALPTPIDYLIVDATGNKRTLEQLAQEITGDILETGRSGILVDFPEAAEGLTQADVERLDLKARLCKYEAISIINWDTIRVGGTTINSLVVLKEVIFELQEDGFSRVEVTQFRVLTFMHLNNDHDSPKVYTQLLLDESGKLKSDPIQPKKLDGTFFDEIPFVYIGSENNDSDVDTVPLYDLARLNLGHYRNSADYEESIHVVGQPSVFITSSLNVDEWAAAFPDGVKIGSRKGHFLGQSGSASLLQPSPNQLADTAMARKEQQALMIGARLITPSGGVETAEAARIRHSSENSVLSLIINNVQAGITQALGFAVDFMGGNVEDIEFKMNKQLFVSSADPQNIMAQIQLIDRGLLAPVDVINNLKKVGLIDSERSVEDILGEVGQMSPLT